MRKEKEYEICLSFAGEDRKYVDDVANILKNDGVKVFYDDFEKINLWGKDIYQHFADVFENKANFCIIFISNNYKNKLWANHELKNAQARAIKENREYILPARFDETELPGITHTTAYIDLRRHSPNEFADIIKKKLSESANSAPFKISALQTNLIQIDKEKDISIKDEGNIIGGYAENYIALDHGIPFYKHENITSKYTGNKLFVAVPEEYQDQLNQDGNVFEIRPSTIKFWEAKLKKSFNYLGLGDHQKLISEAANEAAEEFVKDIRKGYHRFNSKLFGVEKLKPNRKGLDEEASLQIDFYSTDYFTYRVFGKIYQKVLNNNNTDKILKIPDLNEYYTPFLSSFGIGCFIIVNRGFGDEVLLAYRSTCVMVDKGKLHYSMNEAFSSTDTESVDNFPSIKECLYRGFREELGIGAKFHRNITKSGFLDLGMITDRCEVGISAFARIEFDHNLKFDDLKQLYAIAQDAELETDRLRLVKISDLEEFLELNYKLFSEGSRSTLKLLLARYEAGYTLND